MDLYRDKIISFLLKTKDKPVFVFDTETTGIPHKDPVVDILEFSCIKIEKVDGKNRVTDSMDIFINPGYKIPKHIIEFNEKNQTGITQKKIDKEGLTQEAAVKKIKQFWGDNPILLGYNSLSFDEPLVKDLFSKVGEELTIDAHLDVLRMCKEKFPSPARGKAISHKLSDMAQLLNCANAGFHNALNDVLATYEVFKKVLPMYKQEEHPEEPYLSIDNFKVLGVNPWKQSYQMRRVYVANTTGAKIYYDAYNRLWVIPGHLPEDDVIAQVYRYLNIADSFEWEDWCKKSF